LGRQDDGDPQDIERIRCVLGYGIIVYQMPFLGQVPGAFAGGDNIVVIHGLPKTRHFYDQDRGKSTRCLTNSAKHLTMRVCAGQDS
jgi:hypothetical protein